MSVIRRDGERGQALVIMAISLTVVLAGAAMVIDGGNAMAQQRGTQNATDAAALAGALVIAEKMSGDLRVDADVVTAMSKSFSNNGLTMMGTSYYVAFDQTVVGTVGRGGTSQSRLTASRRPASARSTLSSPASPARTPGRPAPRPLPLPAGCAAPVPPTTAAA